MKSNGTERVQAVEIQAKQVPVHSGDSRFVLALFPRGGGDKLTKPLQQDEWVYTCVDIRAKNFSQVEPGLFTGPRRDRQEIESSPIVELLANPNPLQTWTDLAYQWEADMALDGESFFLMTDAAGDPIVSEGTLPERLWPIRGTHFKAKPKADGLGLDRWELSIGGKPRPIEVWQVLHFKYYNPYMPLRGIGPLAAAGFPVRQNFKSSIWNESVLDNDAVPAGFFETEFPLDAKTREEMKAAQEDEHKSPVKKGKTEILTGGLKFKAAGVSPKDMEWGSQKKWNRDAVFAVFRVPPFEAGITEDVNRATATASKSKLWDGAILPDQRVMASVFDRVLAAWGAGDAFLGFHNENVEALKEGFTDKLEQADKLALKGYTQNEINERLELGMPQIPGEEGNLRLAPLNVQTLEEIADPLGPEDAGEGVPPVAPVPPGDDEEPDEDADDERGAEVETKATPTWQRLQRRIHRPAERRWRKMLLGHMRVDRDKTLANARRLDRKSLDALSAKVKAVGPFWFDPGRECLVGHTIDGAARVWNGFGDCLKDLDLSDLDAILFDLAQSDKRLRRLSDPLYEWIKDKTLEFTDAQLGGLEVADPDSPSIAAFFERKQFKIVRVNRVTRARVAAEIAKGLRLGEGIDKLVDRINKGFRGAASPARRLRIARTETATSVNGVRFEAFQMEGVGEHEWDTADDDHVRTTHDDQDGVIREVGQPFPNGLRYPGDENGEAAEVINCRCAANPIVR